MKTHLRLLDTVAVGAILTGSMLAQDWPQWRGSNRDGKAGDFSAPAQWPAELNKKWSKTIGTGDATPARVGDKIFTFTRQGSEEIVQCLAANNGKEIWSHKYEAPTVGGAAGSHPGPRSSPTVAQGKVITLGVGGVLTCLDAATGKQLWQKDETPKVWPRFYTSMSPLIVDRLVIAQLGGENQGGIFAYDLVSGDPKWKWTDDGTAYASPVPMTVEGVKSIVTLTAKKIVSIALADGQLLWEAPFAAPGRAYNAATPIVEGPIVICTGSGRGAKAFRVEKSGEGLAAKEIWSNPDHAVQFNSPVLKESRIYGLSQKGDLFCLESQTGKTLWTTPMGARDFGSIVDAGSVLIAMTTSGELTVFKPSETEFTSVAKIKVAATPVYSYPVLTGNQILVKDKETLTEYSLN